MRLEQVNGAVLPWQASRLGSPSGVDGRDGIDNSSTPGGDTTDGDARVFISFGTGNTAGALSGADAVTARGPGLRPLLDSITTHSTASRRQLVQGCPPVTTSQRTLRLRQDRHALDARRLHGCSLCSHPRRFSPALGPPELLSAEPGMRGILSELCYHTLKERAGEM